MSDDFERFVAGDGRLAGVLRAHPEFEPPAGMEARLVTALDALDANDAVAGFEPPAQLEAAVMAEADRLDAAQRPRRDALIAAAARGDDPAIDELGPAAQRWLRAQAPTNPDHPAASRRVRRWPWLARAGGAVAAMLALGVAMQLWFDPQASRVAQESDAEIAATAAPASPAPPPAADAAPSPPAEARPQREAKRADFARERSESSGRPPAMAALRDSAEAVGNTAAPMAKANPSKSSAEADAARGRQQAPRALPLKRAEREVPRQPPAVAASPPTSPSTGTTGRASAVRERFAEVAPAAPMASAVAPEAEAARQDATEDRAGHDSVRLTLAVTTSAENFVARITTHPPQRWQVSVAPADRYAAQTLIDAAVRQLYDKGRSDRFVVVEASRAMGTMEVESAP